MKKPLTERFWQKVARRSDGECWEWTAAVNEKGYGHFGDWRDGRTRALKAHRVAWELINGPLDDPAICVLHRCDNPPCCNPAHLFLGDRGDNFRDCLAKGRRPPGNPTLKPEQVIAIRMAGGTHQAIADQYGCDRATISYIKSGKTWRHV